MKGVVDGNEKAGSSEKEAEWERPLPSHFFVGLRAKCGREGNVS